MRLVPNQNPGEIARLFREYVESLAPDTVKLSVHALHGAEPVLIERDIPQMQAAARALEQGFGAPPVFMREGGSIGVVATLQKELGTPVVLMGFGLPDDNLHAPNEKFHLPNLYRGVETVIHFLNELAT
jgi:acetylornithine deacetylase/succinyl-diaminopimelate desuccinylase-like protein